jgi:hypothetical protein
MGTLWQVLFLSDQHTVRIQVPGCGTGPRQDSLHAQVETALHRKAEFASGSAFCRGTTGGGDRFS